MAKPIITSHGAIMIHYIGLDAHSLMSTFTCVDSKGQETKSVRVATTESQLFRFLKELKGTKKLVFDESNISKWLHTMLHDKVDELVVCNPVYLARLKKPFALAWLFSHPVEFEKRAFYQSCSLQFCCFVDGNSCKKNILFISNTII